VKKRKTKAITPFMVIQGQSKARSLCDFPFVINTKLADILSRTVS